MAARELLHRKGLPSEFYIGVANPDGAGLASHAWLKSGSQIVVGGDVVAAGGLVDDGSGSLPFAGELRVDGRRITAGTLVRGETVAVCKPGETPRTSRITEAMKGMGFEIIDDGLGVAYVPGPEDLEQCLALGRKIASNL